MSYIRKGTFTRAELKTMLNINPVFNLLPDEQKNTIIDVAVQKVANQLNSQGLEDYQADTSSGENYYSPTGSLDIESVTYDQLLGKIGNLTSGTSYHIKDKDIIVSSVDENSFSPKAIYLYKKGKKAWGALTFTGTAGDISSLSINGVNILSYPISYSDYFLYSDMNPGGEAIGMHVGMLQFVKDIAQNINENSSDYRAYACYKTLIIESSDSGDIEGTITEVLTGNLAISYLRELSGGTPTLATPLPYECVYDFPNDRILMLHDPLYDNTVSYDSVTVEDDVANCIFEFNWNDPKAVNNTFKNCLISRQFIVDGFSGFSSGMAFVGNHAEHSEIGANLIIAGGILYNVIADGVFSGNMVNNASGTIASNQILGSGGDIYARASDMIDNYVTGAGINSNILNGGGQMRYCEATLFYGIQENTLGNFCTIWGIVNLTAFMGNKLRPRTSIVDIKGSGYSIFTGNEFTDDSMISNLSFEGTVYFINNKIHSGDTRPHTGEVVSQRFKNCGIFGNIFIGSYFTGNDIEGLILTESTGLDMFDSYWRLGNYGQSYVTLKGFRSNGNRFSFTFQISLTETNNAATAGMINGGLFKMFSIINTGVMIDSGYMTLNNIAVSGSPVINIGLSDEKVEGEETYKENPNIPTPNNILSAYEVSGSVKKVNFDLSGLPLTTDLFGHVAFDVSGGRITAGTLIVHIEGYRIV